MQYSLIVPNLELKTWLKQLLGYLLLDILLWEIVQLSITN